MDEPEESRSGDESSEEDVQETEQPSRPRIPDDDGDEDYDQKRFLIADDIPLGVTVASGPIASSYAPAELLAKVAATVGELIKDLTGGYESMLYGVVPTNSMTLYFGDPMADDAQTSIPAEVTHNAALRVLEILEAEADDQLLGKAMNLGAQAAQSYSKLAHLVDSERIELEWKPREERSAKLAPRRAHEQYLRLTAEPPMKEEQITINGRLYRVITEPPEGERGDAIGSVGIRLFSWSLRPPRYENRTKLLAHYEKPEVAEAIKNGLVDEPVETVLLIRRPEFGASIDPDRAELVVNRIKKGPAEDTAKGISMEDLLEEDE